jgi:glycosyltransferase involved in cell wall biosynthesis
MGTPKISVIMPAYNHERYVGEAIESVLNQSFKDFEFIIINDGSTDNTGKVITSYKDHRIKYFEQDNQDAYNAINKGVGFANGEYIALINSDDKYHPERLSTLVAEAEKHGAKFIVTSMWLIDSDSVVIENEMNAWHTWYKNLLSVYQISGSLIETMLTGNITVTSSNFFYKSDIIKECGEFKPFRYCHDYDFALEALFRYNTGFRFLVNDKLLYYRVHDKNTISESVNKTNSEVFHILLDSITKIFINGLLPDNITILTKQLNHLFNFTYCQVEANEKQANQHLQSVRRLEENLSWFENQRDRWQKAAEKLQTMSLSEELKQRVTKLESDVLWFKDQRDRWQQKADDVESNITLFKSQLDQWEQNSNRLESKVLWFKNERDKWEEVAANTANDYRELLATSEKCYKNNECLTEQLSIYQRAAGESAARCTELSESLEKMDKKKIIRFLKFLRLLPANPDNTL